MIDESKITYISFDDAENAPEGIVEHIKDRYWIVNGKKGLVFVDDVPFVKKSEEKADQMLLNFDPRIFYVKFMSSVFRKVAMKPVAPVVVSKPVVAKTKK